MAKREITDSAVAAEPTMQIGEDLWIQWVDVAALKEQDVNAQQMQPRHYDRLTENIKIRGQIESLPYCYQANGIGPIAIVSGHHRARAARSAGLTRIPVIVDHAPMTQSQIIAKQIAHNELVGSPDEEILRQLVAAITSVDDMLMTGLDETFLPAVEPDDTNLMIPHAEFDWRMVTLLFLPKQMKEFEDVIAMLDRKTEVVGVADADQFSAFSKALLDFARIRNIKSMAAAIFALTRIAREEVEKAQTEPDQKTA